LQFRNGFYYAAAFVVAFWAFALNRIPPEGVAVWIPLFILSNILINTFYFIAGLVLLEKAEGSLIAQSVTPLRPWEYLASKLVTLSLVSVCESLVIILLGYRETFGLPQFLIGVLLSAVLFSLGGFLLVSRYNSINEFLFPSFLFTLVFVPPFLSYFGFIESAWIYLHPLQGPMLWTQAAFGAIATWQAWYAAAYSILWIAAGLLLSSRALERFVVAVEGES
jgi:fluoroquinolone transport system permease protein